jgi:hypothetical protein
VTEGEEAQRGGKQANIIKADVSVKAGAKVSVTATRRLWQARYKYLLDAAKQLNADGHHAAAIVTAQTACEVCTAVVFTAALRAKGVESLTDPLRNLILSYSLANERVRNLYVALSGDRIQDEPFWSDFKVHATLRRDIVHEGQSATAEDADKSIAAVKAVIDHLLQNRP